MGPRRIKSQSRQTVGGELLLLCVKRVTDAGAAKHAQKPADAVREEKVEKDGDRI